MMNKRMLALTALFLMFATMLFACNKSDVSISYGEDGSYTGFSNVPSTYTAADAIDDGCLVIDIIQGTNKYGATITQECETAGYENWQSFRAKTESGEDAFLRVAYFIDGIGYYHDLYYCNGRYTIFDFNEFGISGGKTYRYLRRLDGYAGPASDPKQDCFYVLTDSRDLTYQDVNWSFLSSDSSSVTTIPFEWLGFMIYFE